MVSTVVATGLGHSTAFTCHETLFTMKFFINNCRDRLMSDLCTPLTQWGCIYWCPTLHLSKVLEMVRLVLCVVFQCLQQLSYSDLICKDNREFPSLVQTAPLLIHVAAVPCLYGNRTWSSSRFLRRDATLVNKLKPSFWFCILRFRNVKFTISIKLTNKDLRRYFRMQNGRSFT